MLTKPTTYLLLIKVLIALATLLFIGLKIYHDPEIDTEFLLTLSQLTHHFSSPWLYLLLGMAILNWSLEAVKWQWLLYKLEPVSFAKALKAVLSGLCLGFITPHSIGDYAGRVFYLDKTHRKTAIGAVALARISLFYITLFYGTGAFVVFAELIGLDTAFFNAYTLLGILCIYLLILLSFFRADAVLSVLRKSKTGRWIAPFVEILESYTFSDILGTFVLSLVRFLVFSAQYMIVLHLLGVSLFSVTAWCAVWLIFFTKSVIPSFNVVSDLSVREAAALYFSGKLGLVPGAIITGSLLLWFVNILLPTLLGLYFIVSSKTKA